MPAQTSNSLVILDLSGGLNEGTPRASIQENQFAALENFYPFGSKLVRRSGIKRLTSAEYSERITTLFPFKLSTGEWLLLAGTETGFAKLVDGEFVALTERDELGLPASFEPWQLRQRLDTAYAVRAGWSGLKRVSTDGFMSAGIEAPAVGPTLSDAGAGGSIEAGAYYGVVVFKNSQTICRSNPSPPSVVQAITINHKRGWANIAVSDNLQVNCRELYVTLPDNVGEYFFVAEINDNFTTTYTDDIDINHLGEPADFGLGLPPPGVELMELWRERLWLSDKRSVFFSRVAQPEGYDALDVIEVYPDDGHEIRCLHADGSRLIVGKTNATHIISPTGEGKFSLSTLSDQHGIIAPDSVRSAEGFLFWYAGDNIYRAIGSMVESISTVPVSETLKAIPETQKRLASAAVWPKFSWYLLSVGFGTAGYNRVVLCYNYKTGSWTRFTGGPGILRSIAALFAGSDPDYTGKLYATAYDGHAYEFNASGELVDPDGNPILCVIEPRAVAQGGSRLAFESVGLLCTNSVETIELEQRQHDDQSPRSSRTVSLSGSGWKEYGFRSAKSLSSQLQLRLTYAGRAHLEIEGLSLGVSQSLRRPVRR